MKVSADFGGDTKELEELMKGYMYKDKVLKYSKVIVCKK